MHFESKLDDWVGKFLLCFFFYVDTRVHCCLLVALEAAYAFFVASTAVLRSEAGSRSISFLVMVAYPYLDGMQTSLRTITADMTIKTM